jgi:hypothetical protein
VKESTATRVTIIFTPQEKIDLKMMALLTNRTVSEFVRLTVKEKIKTLRIIPKTEG